MSGFGHAAGLKLANLAVNLRMRHHSNMELLVTDSTSRPLFIEDAPKMMRPKANDAPKMMRPQANDAPKMMRPKANDAPKANELLNLCKKIIQKLSAQHLSSQSSGDYVMNRHQCSFLVGKLTLDTQVTLEKIQHSPFLDEKTTPVLQVLHQVLQDLETILNASPVTDAQWPRPAMEQGEMKETFSRLLYDIQWHTSVLLSILMDNSGESNITFKRELCDGQLTVGDEFALLMAMKEDERSLMHQLLSVRHETPTAKRLANQILLKSKLDYGNKWRRWSQLPGNREPSTDSTGFTLVPSDLLFLNPEDLDLSGSLNIGSGASAQVREFNLLGGKYAVKIFKTYHSHSFDKEMAALQGLGHHPHIVRHLCYSKDETKCYLIMELMDKDLSSLLSEVLAYRRTKNLLPKRPFSHVQAVALMLQVAEGTRYIHSKGMAHRDLKSGNILVNLADPSSPSSSRVSAVKIADFGLSKTKNTSQTYSNQTWNTGTRMWMAPEVIRGNDDPEKATLNPRKADVYSFAIICVEILTGEEPYSGLSNSQMKEQVKAGTLRPKLPGDCPPRLATLIQRCWHPVSHQRPLFPEICKELRYMKGLLLRGDQKMLEQQEVLPFRSMGRAQLQGPWGGAGGGKFCDMGTSIKRIKLRYSQSPGFVGSMEVEYKFDNILLVKTYCDNSNGDIYKEMVFEQFEFITHVSGYVSHLDLQVGGLVVSITIHTNIKSYGPFGDENGEPFTSDIGRVIGFHGRGGAMLDSLGVVIILGDM